MKRFLLLSFALFSLPLAAQTPLEEYRQAVISYSLQLKAAAARSQSAGQTLGQARTGFLPRLAMEGSFTATAHHYDGVKQWTFGVLPQLVQVVYGGGSVRAGFDHAEAGYGIALCEEEFSRLEVRYAADYAYWNLSALDLYTA
ncbi:MAG: TolC family protein, partial [Alistipes sp.]|nr:TolC family protein [Alistipes sp.]